MCRIYGALNIFCRILQTYRGSAPCKSFITKYVRSTGMFIENRYEYIYRGVALTGIELLYKIIYVSQRRCSKHFFYYVLQTYQGFAPYK